MTARRSHGTGRLYEKSGSWYGRWWIDGRRVNRKLGPVRQPGTRSGLTKVQAEKAMRKQIEDVTAAAPLERLTVADVGAKLVESMEVRGLKQNTITGAESTIRVHLAPYFGSRALDKIERAEVERFVKAKQREGCSPKSIRNYLSTLHSIYELAIDEKWARHNPVKRAKRPRVEAYAEIRYLTLEEVEAVIAHTADDGLGEVERVLYLMAAMTGLREGELFGIQWQDIDWSAGKGRVRRSYTRGEFLTPKSRRGFRAVPIADRLATELKAHKLGSYYSADEDLVFAHPETGNPLDASKTLKRFKAALKRAGVREVRFHDLRHTFGTQCAGAGVPMRTLQEWMGHRDIQTTQRYADYAPDDRRERDVIERAFVADGLGSNLGSKLSETERNRGNLNRSRMRG